jgi:hypothetical protein
VCDLTEPKCNKCAKKGLDCPGYGIRYRFADGKTASAADFEPADSARTASSSSSASALSAKRRQPDLKWVDVSSRVKRARGGGEQGQSRDTTTDTAPPGPTAGTSGECSDITRQHRGIHAYGPSRQPNGSGSHDHQYWPRQARETSPQGTLDSSSTEADENDVIEITRTGDFGTLARPDFSPLSMNLPSLLSNPDPRIRLLFKHCEPCPFPAAPTAPFSNLLLISRA